MTIQVVVTDLNGASSKVNRSCRLNAPLDTSRQPAAAPERQAQLEERRARIAQSRASAASANGYGPPGTDRMNLLVVTHELGLGGGQLWLSELLERSGAGPGVRLHGPRAKRRRAPRQARATGHQCARHQHLPDRRRRFLRRQDLRDAHARPEVGRERRTGEHDDVVLGFRPRGTSRSAVCLGDPRELRPLSVLVARLRARQCRPASAPEGGGAARMDPGRRVRGRGDEEAVPRDRAARARPGGALRDQHRSHRGLSRRSDASRCRAGSTTSPRTSASCS